MAYTKTVWKDEIVQHPKRFTATENDDGTLTLEPAFGTTLQEGTPVNAANLNKIEKAISETSGHMDTAIELYNDLNLFKKSDITYNKFVDSSGNIADGAGLYDLSDYMKTNGYFRVKYESTGHNFRIAFYDTNKNFVKRTDFSQEAKTFRYDWTGYIRVVLYTQNNTQQHMDYDSIIIVHGSDLPEIVTEYTAIDRVARDALPKDKIAMFGDSITWGAMSGGRTDKGLPYWVGKVTGCETDNFGIGSQGWTVAGSDGKTAIENIQGHDLTDYDAITLQYGINDSNAYLGTYTDTSGTTIMAKMYEAISYLYTTYPGKKIIVIAPTNTTNKGSAPRYRLDAAMLRGYTGQQMIDEYRKFCEYYCIPLVTYELCPANTFNISTLLYDNVHPNLNGYKIYGMYLGNRLKEYLN